MILSDLTASIACTLVRGGTSKGLMFLDDDLPASEEERFSAILKIMGAPDKYKNQANGVGGGKSTNNKVAIVGRSSRKDIDIDYLFYQITPDLDTINTKANCGNFLAAVPFYAIYKGLMPYKNSGITEVKIFNINTGQIIHAKVLTDKKGLITKGDTIISGVSGGFSQIELEFFNIVGSTTGKLFPTGDKMNKIDDIRCSIVDVSVPMVIIDGTDLGVDAKTKTEFLKSLDFTARLQDIRRKASRLFGFNDVVNSVIPKISILCESTKDAIKSFYYDPFTLHDSHAITGAMCLASACLLEGTVANKICKLYPKSGANKVTIDHISGVIDVVIDFDSASSLIHSASFISTASILMDGRAFVY